MDDLEIVQDLEDEPANSIAQPINVVSPDSGEIENFLHTASQQHTSAAVKEAADDRNKTEEELKTEFSSLLLAETPAEAAGSSEIERDVESIQVAEDQERRLRQRQTPRGSQTVRRETSARVTRVFNNVTRANAMLNALHLRPLCISHADLALAFAASTDNLTPSHPPDATNYRPIIRQESVGETRNNTLSLPPPLEEDGQVEGAEAEEAQDEDVT